MKETAMQMREYKLKALSVNIGISIIRTGSQA